MKILITILILIASAIAQVPSQFTGLPTSSTDLSATYDSPAKPAQGGTYTNQSPWNNSGTRISQPTDCNGADCSLQSIYPQYSRRQPWCATSDKMLIWETNGYYQLYNGTSPYAYQKIIHSEVSGAYANPGWANSGCTTFYYNVNMDLKSYNITTDARTTVKTFSCTGCVYLSNGEEGNQSDDDRYWAFYTQDVSFNYTHFISYDKDTDTVLATKTLAQMLDAPSGNTPNWVGMSPDGSYVLVGWNFGSITTGRGSGTDLFDRNLDFVAHLTDSNNHGDVGYDVNGVSVYYTITQASSGTPYYTITVWKLSDRTTSTIALPCSFAYSNCGVPTAWAALNFWHFSGRATSNSAGAKGWMLMSTYAQDGNNTQCSGGWGCSELIAVKIDTTVPTGTTWVRLGRTYSIRNAQYFGEPHAVPNPDFTKIMFGSNWLTNGGQVAAYVQTFSAAAATNGSIAGSVIMKGSSVIK